MKKPKPILPNIYSRDYFLKDCSGYELFNKTEGKILNDRLKRVFDISRIKKNEVVLDMGCGRGEITYQAAVLGCKVFAIDYSLDAVNFTEKITDQLPKQLRNNIKILQMDAKKLDFPSNFFDVIIMADFVEHLHDWELEKVFKTTKKLLKKNGRLIIHTSPNKWYINYIYPPLRLASMVLGKDLGPVRKNYPDEKEHVNEQTPLHLKKLLGKHFKTKIWCENLYKAKWINKFPLVRNFAISIFAVAQKVK